ncbi:MAG: DUF3445 domain-containing protein [Pseudomonadota bacterium]
MKPAAPIEQATVTLAEAPFLPFLDSRTARAPGLSPLDPSNWILTGPDYAAQMRLRRRLVDARPEIVLGQTDDASEGLSELLDLLVAHLRDLPGFRADGADLIRPDGVRVAVQAEAPLVTIAQLVAEDFCLMQRRETGGEYCLMAAALCFPSRWSLGEKLGRPMTAIHEPVPDYDAVLARRVARVFDMLAPERPVFRVNWLMHDDPALHQTAHRAQGASTAHGPAAGLYLRTEHQTLRRLPRSGAIAFGIRTHITPIEGLRPLVRERLGAMLAGLDPATIDYRIGAEDLAEGRAFIETLGDDGPSPQKSGAGYASALAS